jgi:hypothetical protein
VPERLAFFDALVDHVVRQRRFLDLVEVLLLLEGRRLVGFGLVVQAVGYYYC